jgi:hypothetical protein
MEYMGQFSLSGSNIYSYMRSMSAPYKNTHSRNHGTQI